MSEGTGTKDNVVLQKLRELTGFGAVEGTPFGQELVQFLINEYGQEDSSTEANEKEVKSLKKIVGQLQKNKDQLSSQLNFVSETLTQSRKEETTLKNEMRVLKDEQLSWESVKSDLMHLVNELSSDKESIQQDLNLQKRNWIQKNEDLKEQCQQYKQDLIIARGNLQVKQMTENKLNDQIKSLFQKESNHKQQVTKLNETITQNEISHDEDIKLLDNLTHTQSKQISLLQRQLEQYQDNDILLKKNDEVITSLRQENAQLLQSLNSQNTNEDLLAELQDERKLRKDMELKLKDYIHELSIKIPLLDSFKLQINTLNQELNDSKLLIENKDNQLTTLTENIQTLENQSDQSNQKIMTLQRVNTDLANQLQYVLIHSQIHKSSKLLTDEQLLFLQNLLHSRSEVHDTQSQQMISKELVQFKDIVSLQEMNSKLIRVTRSLSDNLETLETERDSLSKINEDNTEIIGEAKTALVNLQDYTDKLESEIELLKEELNLSKEQIPTPSPVVDDHIENPMLDELRDEITNLHSSNNNLQLKYEAARSTNELQVEKLNILEQKLSLSNNTNKQLQFKLKQSSQSLKERESEIFTTVEKFNESKTQVELLQSKLKLQDIEINELKFNINLLRDRELSTNDQLCTQSTQLSQLEESIQSKDKEITTLKEHTNQLQALNEKNTEELAVKDSIWVSLMDNSSDRLKWYRDNIGNLQSQNKSLTESLNEKDKSMNELKNKVIDLEKCLQTQIDQYKQDLLSTSKELEDARVLNTSHDKSIDDLTSNYEQKLSKLNQEITEKLTALETLEKNNQELVESRKSLTEQNSDLMSKYTQVQASESQLRQISQEQNTEIEKLQSKIKILETTAAKVHDDHETLVKNLKNQIEQCQNEAKQLHGTIQGLQNDVALSKSTEVGSPDMFSLKKLNEEKHLLWNQLASSQHEEVLLRNTLSETRKELRNITQEIESAKIPNNTNETATHDMNSLLLQLEDYKIKIVDAENRFDRLKKQAHEKLNQSKNSVSALSTEINDMKTLNNELEANLKLSETKILELEKTVIERKEDEMTINSLKNELSAVLARSKEVEVKLDENIQSSDKLIGELNNEIEELRKELKILKQTKPIELEHISETVESMKKTFEEEKIRFIEETRKEYGEKLSQELSSKEANTSLADTEALKSQLEKEMQDKIDKIMKENEATIEEKTKLLLEDKVKEGSDVYEKIKEDIMKKNESAHEDELQKMKSKSFEEGKQQASMRTTLLERKISKLESQLKEVSNLGDESSKTPKPVPVTVSTPDTIPVGKSSPFQNNSNNKLNFGFQSSSSLNNPFTSPLDKNVFISSNAASLKPTFALNVGQRTASDIDTSEMTRDSSSFTESDESNNTTTNNNGLKRAASDEIPSNIFVKRSKESSVPPETEKNDESNENKELSDEPKPNNHHVE